MTTAAFVLDGGPAIGLGHLRRGQRLMAAFAARGVACRLLAPAEALAAGQAPAAEPWPAELGAVSADIVIADSYRLRPEQVAAWKESGALAVVIDDLADRTLPADVVLNHNVNGAELDYAAWGARRVMAGLEWCLVGPEFIAARRRDPAAANAVLVSFGGVAGPHGEQTARALLRAMDDNGRVHLVVPRGAEAPSISDPRLVVLRAPDMATAMREAGSYVGAAGVTALEATAARMSLAVCALYDNQAKVADFLRRHGVAAFASFDAEALARAAVLEMAADGGRNPLSVHIDGRGPERAASAILGVRNFRAQPEPFGELCS